MNTLRSVSLLAFASLALSASAQNLVQNGDFADDTGWSLSGNTFGGGIMNGRAFFLGATDEFTFLSQTITTTVGTTYTFSFDAYSLNSGTGNSFAASFGGQSVLPATTLPRAIDYTRYSYRVVADSASTTLTFAGYNDPTVTFLDNVSVVADAAPAVPGPLAALPFALIALRRRKRA